MKGRIIMEKRELQRLIFQFPYSEEKAFIDFLGYTCLYRDCVQKIHFVLWVTHFLIEIAYKRYITAA